MNKRLSIEIVFRAVYLTIATFALLGSICFWCSGNGTSEPTVNPYFFLDFFVWTVIMSIVAVAGGLADNLKSLRNGEENYSKTFPFLKFCTFSSMIFCFIMGAFFIDRIGYNRLTDFGTYGSIYPGVATAGYWLNFPVFLTRFLCPLGYIALYLCFEEKCKARKLYAKLGVVPPTVFYLFDKFFGLILKAAYGSNEILLEKGLYEVAYPFFFYDEYFTYKGWWWIILWPSIFGLALLVINKVSLILTKVKIGENGKLYVDKKTKFAEEEMKDIFHPIIVKRQAKKALSTNIATQSVDEPKSENE